MQPRSDAELLRKYADEGVEAAFAEIVRRHTNLVYSTALRMVNSPDTAADIAQNVFVAVARGARTLSSHMTAEASLAGWLCRATRNQVLKLWRDESRRQSRERQAMQLLRSEPETGLEWQRLRSVLDEAMAELAESDYDALVLRFFENDDFRAVGRALGVSDDAAQKRVSRALSKLREILTRRRIDTTAAALSLAISANAVHAAPAGLASNISAAAGLSGTSGFGATVTTLKGVSMTVLQKTIAGAVLAGVIGIGVYEGSRPFVGPVLSPEAGLGVCLNNLQRIDAAIQMCAFEKHIAATDPISFNQIVPYLREHQLPRCPSGGKYAIATSSHLVSCTIPGHALAMMEETPDEKAAREAMAVVNAAWKRDHPGRTNMDDIATAVAAYKRDHQGQEPGGIPELAPYLTPSESFRNATDAYKKDHNGQKPQSVIDLAPYLKPVTNTGR